MPSRPGRRPGPLVTGLAQQIDEPFYRRRQWPVPGVDDSQRTHQVRNADLHRLHHADCDFVLDRRRGRMLIPAPISTACLIVSMLSNSMHHRTVDADAQGTVEFLADGQVVIECDELSPRQVRRLTPLQPRQTVLGWQTKTMGSGARYDHQLAVGRRIGEDAQVGVPVEDRLVDVVGWRYSSRTLALG